jgi:hypothetical protein
MKKKNLPVFVNFGTRIGPGQEAAAKELAAVDRPMRDAIRQFRAQRQSAALKRSQREALKRSQQAPSDPAAPTPVALPDPPQES